MVESGDVVGEYRWVVVNCGGVMESGEKLLKTAPIPSILHNSPELRHPPLHGVSPNILETNRMLT
jgi:hypothetical protein